MASGRQARIARQTAVLLVLLPGAVLSHADCATDLRGEVFCGAGRCATTRTGEIYCSKHYEGDARTTLRGDVVCGRGNCARDRSGRFVCSTEIGGAVLRDSRGEVRCYRSCEPASLAHCEQTVADGPIGG